MLGLQFQDLSSGFEPIHNRHHEVHYDELEILFAAVYVCASEEKSIFKLLDRFLSISRLLWKNVVPIIYADLTFRIHLATEAYIIQ